MNIRNFLLIALLGVGIAVIVLFPGKDIRKIHPMTNELAVQPDHMILNATQYLAEEQTLTSTDYIEKAIDAMRLIEVDADSVSDRVIEEAIKDLKLVEEELKKNQLNDKHINRAFLNALNSLAFAQLRLSEVYQLQGEKNYARVAMEYATKHLHNAVQFSKADEIDKEIHLYQALDSLIPNKSLSNEQVIAKLDQLIGELDKMVAH